MKSWVYFVIEDKKYLNSLQLHAKYDLNKNVSVKAAKALDFALCINISALTDSSNGTSLIRPLYISHLKQNFEVMYVYLQGIAKR